MNELRVQDYQGEQVIDSRDVAAMVERGHSALMKSIRGYIGYLNEGEIAPVDFFIENSYVDDKGEIRPCYLITKKGCDMIANKMTGKKGVLFTAAYVTAFDEMSRALREERSCAPAVSPGGLARLITVTRQVMLDMGSTPQDIGKMIQNVFSTWNVPVPQSLHRQIEGQISLFDRQPRLLEN